MSGGSILGLAWRSLMNRKGSALLTLLAVALSVALFLGVDKARNGARAGFDNTISGTDLIVGAPTGQINLLLYSVFRLGNATAEISWPTYQDIAGRSDVAWTIPVSLGDSHRGFRVMGTNAAYFEHYKYGSGTALEIAEGRRFDDIYEAVLGASVARELGYGLGSEIVLTHGLGAGGLTDHDDKPFIVTGVLAPTGTPVDQTIHIPLEGMTAIHVGWETGTKSPLADTITEDMIRSFDLTPKTITAVFLGLERRGTILTTQRALNTRAGEPLLAIIPGVALGELWQVTSVVERALIAVSIFVIAVGLVSVLISILTSLNERRREMSILRATGARPGHIFFLMVAEAGLLGFVGALLGVLIVQAGLFVLGPMLASSYGVKLQGLGLAAIDLWTILAVTAAAIFIGFIPAIMALRRSLADGLTVKL
ncbi:ABC transporter permease [Henriciella pelagia]|jgi:putative ABC transport system permease protein|uniref:Peptide ABC transporter permease n=1 Tax=Henriciella pelagia TaxID=1977912 RepID=A0ABQ1JN10_9PROT|nr:ABC transporter permease [Henriciella pelagia]GGB70335.1 peptide ABC transporter permease [Henriciella pelagia]